jgi:hypothetical protein
MSGQREGFLGDILDKVKDLITDDEPQKDPKREEDPPLTPQCCGKPPIQPVVGGQLISEGELQHELNCPNHPDNLAKQEVAS